jgi:hypothetical protein
MKAYGHSRRDKLECEYGCCTGKSGKRRRGRLTVDRANRKTARQEAKRSASEATDSPDAVNSQP